MQIATQQQQWNEMNKENCIVIKMLLEAMKPIFRDLLDDLPSKAVRGWFIEYVQNNTANQYAHLSSLLLLELRNISLPCTIAVQPIDQEDTGHKIRNGSPISAPRSCTGKFINKINV